METKSNQLPPELFLASQSSRRRELLKQVGVEFNLAQVDVLEIQQADESAQDYVRRLAVEKATAALSALPPDVCVLGADTVVVLDGEVLEKPRDQQHAEATLLRLAGRSHTVVTGVAVVNQQVTLSKLCSTTVNFRPISREEAQLYWQTGEPVDKAGAYGIQGYGAVFVESINGSYSNVVGLPLFETHGLLSEFGIPVWRANCP